jgi:hypothetical protein
MKTFSRRRIVLEPGHEGQAIVLIAVMLVVLLGMAALAIDGGGLFFLKRDAQNAADAAALIAVRELCVSENPTTADFNRAVARGLDAAKQNNFEHGTSRETALNIQVAVRYPTAGEYTSIASGTEDEYIVVTIDAEKTSYFARFVFSGPLAVHVSAIGHCTAPRPPSNTYALTGLRLCGACGGGESNAGTDFSGSLLRITGGVHSNCNCDLGGGSVTVDTMSCTGADTGDVDFDPPSNGPAAEGPVNAPAIASDPLANIYKHEDFKPDGSYAQLAADDCVGCPNSNFQGCLADTADPTNDGTSDDDCYHNVNASALPDSPSELDAAVFEGLYYITGEWTPSNGATITIGPKGATFVSASHLSFPKLNKAQAYLRGGALFAASYAVDMCGPQKVIDIGTSGASWYGVIYAPSGECGASLSGIIARAAFICQKVNLSGSSYEIHWDPEDYPREGGSLQQTK